MEEQDQQELERAESLISEASPFVGIESMHIELDEDSTGDPSMWIVFRLKPGFRGDVSWVQEFTEHSTKLRRKLLNSGQKRFPYTRIERPA